MVLFSQVCMHPDLGNPDDAHPLHNNLGIIKAARDCCGRVMQLWHHDIGDWRVPRGRTPLICISYRNSLCWAPIAGLGDQFLGRYKAEISNFIKNSFDKPRPDTLGIMGAMYIELTKEQRVRFLQTELFKTSDLIDHICPICYDYTKNSITKCIHVDCPGCCEKCHATPLLVPKRSVGIIGGGGGGGSNEPTLMEIVCPSCKRKQEMECPICYESKPAKELCVLGCNHSFCWKCYGHAVMQGQQITKCPMCRTEIVEIIDKN